MSLQSIAALLDGEATRSQVEHAVESLDATIADIPTTIFALRTHERGNRDSVLDLARCDRDAQLSPCGELRGCGARHAEATSVQVTLSAGREIVLLLEDNGRCLLPTILRRTISTGLYADVVP